jgi:hypothetical protein
MFRSFSGFKAQYQDLTLVVVSEFNEWKVVVRGPGVLIQGERQFDPTKAKQHALAIAQCYLREEEHQEAPLPSEVEWTESGRHDWLVWRG